MARRKRARKPRPVPPDAAPAAAASAAGARPRRRLPALMVAGLALAALTAVGAYLLVFRQPPAGPPETAAFVGRGHGGAVLPIRKDRAAFSTLVREQDRIAAAGDVLVSQTNRQRAMQDARLLASVQALARRKGHARTRLHQ